MIDLSTLFKRTRELCATNWTLRRQLDQTLSESREAVAEEPDYEAITAETEEYAERRAHPCKDK